MKISIELMHPFGADSELKKIIGNRCELEIFKDEENWVDEPDNYCYTLILSYGLQKEIHFDIELTQLEMFTNAIQKSIDVLRNDYKDVIKDKILKGDNI
jgi:hypothetical protein